MTAVALAVVAFAGGYAAATDQMQTASLLGVAAVALVAVIVRAVPQ
jgi:hypothetical protein